MKKYFAGLAAIILAVGVSSFTTVRAKPVSQAFTSFFWYSDDGLTNLGQGSLPNNGCSASGTGCAKGYSSQPAHPETDTPNIRVKS